MSKYGTYSCYHCLCEVCTKIYCKNIYRRYTVGFCTSMIMREYCPVIKCDFFEHKEKRKVMRVKRRYRKTDRIISRLEAIEKGLADLANNLP